MVGRVWEQYRSVQIGGYDFSGFDMEIKLSKPESDPLEFDIKIWNLTTETWQGIDKDATVLAELGWADGTRDTVLKGVVESKSRSMDEDDFIYRLQGTAETESDLSSTRFSQTWKKVDPTRIANDIARRAGLLFEGQNVGQQTPGHRAITTDRAVTEWLDELIELAREYTGENWEWFVDRETLHFVPVNSTVGSSPKLSFDGLLIEISPKQSGEQDSEVQRLEFESMLDPRFRKGSRVEVDTDRFSGGYEVVTYEYQSHTTNGDHILRGTLESLDSDTNTSADTSTSIPNQ